MVNAPGIRGSKGFTLLELMVVITIIGVLATIAVPMYQASITRAKEAALKEDLFEMRSSIDKHYADFGKYPESLSALVEKKYIRALPIDPFTGSDATWEAVAVLEEDGVYDVRSGSDLVGRNGVPYNEW
ncbi:MAG: prepilin-type N-terminal cleavage/methylation domain-containing protein [Deltaproteobacteria bacterium]|nr:prepilin-type N-terminal cleavage/methylation domain-containing protein [Deltaproteobacteria bacterium]